MDPKHRKVLLAKMEQIRTTAEQFPAVRLMFPQAFAAFDELHREVLYEKVESKTRGIVVNSEKLTDIKDFFNLVAKFRNKITNAANSKQEYGHLYLSAAQFADIQGEVLGYLNTQMTACNEIFKQFMLDLIDKVNNFKGMTLQEFCVLVNEVSLYCFGQVDYSRAKGCRSIQEIRALDIPLVNYYLDHYRSQFNNQDIVAPDILNLFVLMGSLFKKAYHLTQTDYEINIQNWLKHLSKQIAQLQYSKYSNVELLLGLLINNIQQQFSVFKEQALLKIQAELNTVIQNVFNSEPKINVKNFCAKLSSAVFNLNAPLLNIEDLKVIKTENYIETELKNTIQFNTVIDNSIDIKSAVFIINQPGFEDSLVARINAWINESKACLGTMTATLIQFDESTLQKAPFLASVTALLAAKEVALFQQEIVAVLNKLTDLTLDTKKGGQGFMPWINIWQEAFAGLSGQTLYNELKKDPEVLRTLNINLNKYLPPSQTFQQALLQCISISKKANADKLQQIQNNINQLGERLIYIEQCKNNREIAKQAPANLNELVRSIYKAFDQRVKNFEAAKARFDIFVGGVNALIQINADTIRLFAKTMFGMVGELAKKVTEELPLVGDLLGQGVDYLVETGADKVVEWSTQLVKPMGGCLEKIEAYSQQAGLKADFENVLLNLERLVNGCANKMNVEIANYTSNGYQDGFTKVTKDTNAAMRNFMSDFNSVLNTIEQALGKLYDGIFAGVTDVQGLEQLMVANFINVNQSQLFHASESWYQGWRFDMLYSEGFVIWLSNYGVITKSEVTDLINFVGGTAGNIWEGMKNAGSAIHAVFSKNPEKFEKLAAICRAIEVWAASEVTKMK